jgi:hypothetical protein
VIPLNATWSRWIFAAAFLSSAAIARVSVAAPAVAVAPTPAPTAVTPTSPAAPSTVAVDPGTDSEVDAENDTAGYTPPLGSGAAGDSDLHLNGYIDVGFAKAQGSGTSFAEGDTRVPADYGVDAFAPAVNARGEAASTDAGGRFVNGFLPRSAGIGGRPSFLLNTLNVDLRYQNSSAPVMVFSRVQFLPRFSTTGGDASRLFVEQAFGRVMPFDWLELAISIGKFDSVFGIEYQDNQANIRTGVTPSLAARYTTGQSIGGKVFYRQQIGPLWSAVSVNAALTNSGNMVESLQPADVSLAGAPVVSARLGYELNLPAVQVKLGGSGLRGPRNDQRDREAIQTMWGVDARIFVAGVSVTGEYVHVDEDEGLGPKTTALGQFPVASGFRARAFWMQAAYGAAIDIGALRRLTPYVRYEQRHATFDGFTPITVDRMTAGLRIDLWDVLIVKGEYLLNRERSGAPDVPNNVYTSSLVYQW